ncbi:NAD(P)/FAD-dependent oxidoreductase [Herbiconiux moechotypicola]|uniref:NAD(P)/FAD-dependent oxidoreductase n=1 Tax=Herbiconiux moechotypicola TaxID=637393 RepID=A0ABN3E3S5_9MICO|nr:NAD(P)/FAD-dependent oxidoreductase [Herbiconiux moechotypicola]MCS5731646.1 NAD(P)/FAD-dependent oxidoreductase [Herbiconiux moechotypicola]
MTLSDSFTSFTEQPWDVVIVGGGSAGLSAALVLARARRRVLVVDAGQPRNRFAPHMHGFLTRDGLSPLELLELGRAEVTGYGAQILEGRAVDVSGEAGNFTVTVEPARADGDAPRASGSLRLTARRLVIATGLRDVLPRIPGLAEQWGTGAVACPYCDGWEARDLRIGVLSTSARNLHQAQLLRQWSHDVTLIGPAAGEVDPEALAGLDARGVRVERAEVTEVVADATGSLVGLRLGDGSVREFDRLFVGGDMVPNDELLRRLGAERSTGPMGEWVASDFTGLTSVPGVWVAGNSAFAGALVPVAVGSGVLAATVVNADLVADDTRLALSAAAV